MKTITISQATARRYVLGRQGLWPGRRWAGKNGTEEALRTIEAVQMDPLNVVARSHDIILWSRVIDYDPAHLQALLYHDRLFFDYGGWLAIYPMSELPFWRVSMRRRESEPRWATFAESHQGLLDEVRAELRARGPRGNRDFTGRTRVQSYRGRKDSALALYYLWLTGELMTHHRNDFERVYDFRECVAPPACDGVAPDDAAEQFFTQKATAFKGLISESEWRNWFAGFIERPVSKGEGQQWLQRFIQDGTFAPVSVEGSSNHWFMLASDIPTMEAIAAGQVPETWLPLTTTTTDEVVFLSPFDIVSTRGRATWLFDFEYLCEFYKPAAKRRWGYYTLPILYGDRLVARLDPKLDRKTNTLIINGFWLEDHAPVGEPAFATALARGLIRFAAFVRAQTIDIAAIGPSHLRDHVSAIAETSIAIG
jgi:uncharacterized protein YcaQ